MRTAFHLDLRTFVNRSEERKVFIDAVAPVIRLNVQEVDLTVSEKVRFLGIRRADLRVAGQPAEQRGRAAFRRADYEEIGQVLTVHCINLHQSENLR